MGVVNTVAPDLPVHTAMRVTWTNLTARTVRIARWSTRLEGPNSFWPKPSASRQAVEPWSVPGFGPPKGEGAVPSVRTAAAKRFAI